MTLLVTGATGFVGGAVIRRLGNSGARVRAATRSGAAVAGAAERATVGSIDGATDWKDAVAGVETVIHLAARVHVMRDTDADPLAAFRKVNTEGTLKLARDAAAAGVRRFVYVSSIKVNGESGAHSETTPVSPRDPYGISKHEAELGLAEVASMTGLEVTVVRPPLVYGPGVKANFHSLMKVVRKGIPLPFGAIRNRRSLVAVDNLADFLACCAESPLAANETFVVSDGEDVSTPELVRRIARAMNKPARLIPVPPPLLFGAARVLGRADFARRLLGDLWLDIAKARATLKWTPPITVDEGIRRAVRGMTA